MDNREGGRESEREFFSFYVTESVPFSVLVMAFFKVLAGKRSYTRSSHTFPDKQRAGLHDARPHARERESERVTHNRLYVESAPL